MTVVLVVSVVLGIFVAFRDHRRRRAAQQVALAAAQANYLNAKLTREVAEIAVTEYTEGILKPDLETLDGEIALAKSDQTQAEERLAAAKRQRDPDKDSASSLAEAKDEARKARLRLKHARERRAYLAKDAKERTLKDLNYEVQSAKANEAAKKAEYDRAKAVIMGWF
jgi:hypothetical protein